MARPPILKKEPAMSDFGFPESVLPVSGGNFACDEIVNSDKLPAGRLATAAEALAYIRGGKATVTLVSVKTAARFTYRVSAAENDDVMFVGLLNGPDNTADYKYLGRISRGVFWAGRKVPKPGDISAEAPSSKAFDWVWRRLVRGELPEALEIWHSGRCGRCARKLTVPASIASGFGPECAGKV
jgi:hypothetical protein